MKLSRLYIKIYFLKSQASVTPSALKTLAEERLEFFPRLGLLIMRSPIFLRLDGDPFAHGNISLSLQLLTFVFGIQAETAQEGTIDQFQTGFITRSEEIDEAETVEKELIGGRSHDAMDTALQITVCPEMQHIGRIDDDTTGNMADVLPLPVTRLEL